MKEDKVFSYLHPFVREEAERSFRLHKKEGESLSEIRLRLGHAASLTFFGRGKTRNVPLSVSLSEKELREVFSRACGGSLYAFEENLKEGFLTIEGGVRVGVGGRVLTKEGKVYSLASVSSLVFRIPHDVPHAADALTASFLSAPRGILLFSPPGAGKTTMLRAFAGKTAQGKTALRVCVVDSRGELSSFPSDALVDVLTGYPKHVGAEIAVRTLSPELIVMDEVGAEDVRTLLSIAACGVPLVASVHAMSAQEVCRGSVGELVKKGVFSSLWDVKADKEAVV